MTKVIILAAGEGSRLHPMTDDKPKCMIEFNKKTLLEYQMDIFKQNNIDKIYIITGHKEKKIPEYGLIKIFNSNYRSRYT